MRTRKRLPSADALIHIAAKAGQLALQASREPEVYRLAGRLFRNEIGHDVEAYAEAVVYQARNGNDLYPDDPRHFLLLQVFMQIVSYRLWEDLWNFKYPDRFGQAWNGQDFALMSVWREKVRAMIKECGQDAVFAMTAQEYGARLIDASANEEAVEALVDWMSNVLYESEKGCEDEAGSSAEVERGSRGPC